MRWFPLWKRPRLCSGWKRAAVVGPEEAVAAAADFSFATCVAYRLGSDWVVVKIAPEIRCRPSCIVFCGAFMPFIVYACVRNTLLLPGKRRESICGTNEQLTCQMRNNGLFAALTHWDDMDLKLGFLSGFYFTISEAIYKWKPRVTGWWVGLPQLGDAMRRHVHVLRYTGGKNRCSCHHSPNCFNAY